MQSRSSLDQSFWARIACAAFLLVLPVFLSMPATGHADTVLTCPATYKLSGSQCIPVRCNAGYVVQGNGCVQAPTRPILCRTGTQLVGDVCRPIQCQTGTRLVGNLCQQIQCQAGTQLAGNECRPIQCQTGTQLAGNECRPIQCQTGTQLVGNECRPIQCQTGTQLVGNNCEIIRCGQGQQLQGNACVQVECDASQILRNGQCVTVGDAYWACRFTGGKWNIFSTSCSCPRHTSWNGAKCTTPRGNNVRHTPAPQTAPAAPTHQTGGGSTTGSAPSVKSGKQRFCESLGRAYTWEHNRCKAAH